MENFDKQLIHDLQQQIDDLEKENHLNFKNRLWLDQEHSMAKKRLEEKNRKLKEELSQVRKVNKKLVSENTRLIVKIYDLEKKSKNFDKLSV